MPLTVDDIEVVIFDYGNTLVPFGQAQLRACDAALAGVLGELYGPPDPDELHALRNADRRAPFGNGFRENSIPVITIALIRTLYGREPTETELEHILRTRLETFISVIEPASGVDDVLEALRTRRRLALISNYPDGQALRTSVARTNLDSFFEVMVVSGDVGFVKPHPLPFRTALDQLGVEPAAAVYVGDNWLADVQGAKRMGMQAVLTEQWEKIEKFDPEPGDHQPDLVICHIRELLEHL